MRFLDAARFSAQLTVATLCLLLVAGVPSAFADDLPSPPPIGYVGVVPRPKPAPAVTAKVPAPDLAEREKETLISATHMSFDQNTNVAVATGHVEIAHAGYVLHADKVTYDQNKDIMHAEGHVAMLHPDGEVSFANEEEVTGDMKQAVAKNISVLFPDNSRLSARTGQRYDGRYMVADKGIYTACNVCNENPDNPPLWQLRAEQIVHDNETHDVYYHDATVDFAGVPVIYTPYLSGPDPTVERRQGFLAPLTGRSTEAGYFAHTPYYFDIAPNKDAILDPIFSTRDNPVLGGEYREQFVNGKLQLDGTMAYAPLLSESTGADKGDRLRGNLNANFLYDINNIWRAGTQVDFVSDKSFLERYDLGSPSSTTSRAFIEGFQGRNYAALSSYYFQDLQPGTQPVQPTILPQANFSALGDPGQTLGGRWSFDSSLLITNRDNSSAALAQQGPETRRFSIDGGWERKLVSDTGLVTTLNGLLRGDTYWADNVVNPGGAGQVFNNVLIARQFEQASITEGYPLGRHGDGYQQILEPLVMITAAPDVKPNSRQPIEDSLDIQFDETSLFAANRYTGTDLIEGGSRVTYGLRQSFIADGGAHFDAFGGQSYNFTGNNQFPTLSGLEDRSSDYVGRISASPGPWLDTDYGFRFSHQDLSPEAEDAHVSFGTSVFRPSLRYVLAYQTETTGVVGTTEELIPAFSSVFAKYWTLAGSYTHAFKPEPGPRQVALGLSYADECFNSGITLQRDYTDRFDVKSGTSVLFHVYLKNLGGTHTDSAMPTFPTKFRQTN